MSFQNIAIFLLLFLNAGVIHAEKYTDEERTFPINGKTAILDDDSMDEIRARWEWPDSGTKVRVHSLFNTADVRWVLDLIAISEILNHKDCENLQLLEAREFDPEKDDKIHAFTGEVGIFDYAWTIDSYGKKRVYRVYNEKGSGDLSVVPAEL